MIILCAAIILPTRLSSRPADIQVVEKIMNNNNCFNPFTIVVRAGSQYSVGAACHGTVRDLIKNLR